MSNYHILNIGEEDIFKDIVWVAFHIVVPNEDNNANPPVNFRTAVKEWLDGVKPEERIVTKVPWLADPELTQIKNGEIYERFVKVKFDPNLTLPQKKAKIEAKYTALASTVPDEIRERLRFWGHSGNVT